MSTVIVKDEVELESVARMLLDTLPISSHTSIIALTGELGAGKTALTKACARILGVTEHVTSPTFVIMKSYETPKSDRFATLTHMDAYRIDDGDELRVLGFAELLTDPSRLMVIEWPERIKEHVPVTAISVSITIGQGGERIVTYD